ncbi:MAG: hypothetical protein IPN03_10365 [Holophagales bacterium]|nr:hypothetical protein [Holophagales bacterium]
MNKEIYSFLLKKYSEYYNQSWWVDFTNTDTNVKYINNLTSIVTPDYKIIHTLNTYFKTKEIAAWVFLHFLMVELIESTQTDHKHNLQKIDIVTYTRPYETNVVCTILINEIIKPDMLLNANPGVVWVDKDGVYNISSAALELVPRKYIEAILNLDPTLNHQIVYQYTAFIIDGLIAGGVGWTPYYVEKKKPEKYYLNKEQDLVNNKEIYLKRAKY